eukprot:Opistho-2@93636
MCVFCAVASLPVSSVIAESAPAHVGMNVCCLAQCFGAGYPRCLPVFVSGLRCYRYPCACACVFFVANSLPCIRIFYVCVVSNFVCMFFAFIPRRIALRCAFATFAVK